MKVLITGSNGLLGQKLVLQGIRKKAVEIIATSRGENRLLRQEGYVFESMDITDKEQVQKVVQRHAPDAIINTAAMTQVDQCEEDREACWKMNVEGVEHLVEVCREAGIHLVHLSTDFIFDGSNGPYREEDEPAPLSHYGRSKLRAEEVIREGGLTSWAIVRTVLIYGVLPDMSRSNIVLWAKGALEKGDPMKVVDDQYRSPTLAEDLAWACLKVAREKHSGIYHIAGPETMSIMDLVREVAAFFQLDPSPIEVVSTAELAQKAVRPPGTGFVLDKAREELGYDPHAFREGLAVVADQLEKRSE